MDRSSKKPRQHKGFFKCALPYENRQTFRLLISIESTEQDSRTNLSEVGGLLQKN